MSGGLIQMNDALYDYLEKVSFRDSPILAEHREETAKDPRHNIAVSPLQGQFMEVLIRALAPKRIVEVGVFTGYSSLIMAMATPPDTKFWCFDVSDKWTKVARRYWEKAGVADKIELRLKPAREGLQELIDEGHAGTMDFIFLDADKWNYTYYWDLGLDLLRTSGLIVADNTLFQGMVVPEFTDEMIRERYEARGEAIVEELTKATHGAREFNAKVARDERVALSMIPVGDGMTFGVKL